jgi:predicted acylesterase/phospholipase RssA
MAGTRSLECDVIMKGGITSGIVYPGAIARLARDWRLRSIGGTSAGAIAAAAAAAMEYGLQSGRNPHAVAQMAAITDQLGSETDQGIPYLRALFAGDPATTAIFEAALPRADNRRIGALARLVAPTLLPVLLVAVGAGAAIGLAFAHGRAPIDGLAATLAGVLAGLVLLLAMLPSAISRIVADAAAAVVGNDYGLATGMARSGACSRADRTPVPALTEWLHATFQNLAGLPLERPLTFGDLWAPEADVMPAETGDRAIDLVLIASDLSHNLSVGFPFLPHAGRLFVCRCDLEALFPPAVVAAIMAAGGPVPEDLDIGGIDRAGLVRLPDPAKLPVLLAARASMAFPGFLSALRLHVSRWQPLPDGGYRQRLYPLLLADGGITSNFPIHLFDGPVPGRPTFALNLVYDGEELEEERLKPRDEQTAGDMIAARSLDEAVDAVDVLPMVTGARAADDPYASLYMPVTNRGRIVFYKPIPRTGPVAGLAGHFMRVVDTARNWGDVQLMNLPGNRDRIAHIRLAAHEGGFNLGMDAATVASLAARGAAAGTVLGERFRPGATIDPLHPLADLPLRLNWDNHRFTRLRSFVAALEVVASRFAPGWDRVSPTSPGLPELVARAGRSDAPPEWQIGYARDLTAAQRSAIAALAEDLAAQGRAARQRALAGEAGADGTPTRGSESPRPKPSLKLRGGNEDPKAGQP